MTTMALRVRFLLPATIAVLLGTAGLSAAGQQGVHLTRNGFRTPIYGVSQVRATDGSVATECSALTAPQVEAARFDRQVSRAMLASMPLAVVSGGETGATFNVTYTDPEGVGFNDAKLGASRRGAFEAALKAWSKVIHGTQPIAVQASMHEMDDGDNNPLTTLLATAGPTEFWLIDGVAMPASLTWQKLGGRYENAKDSDITVNANDKASWDYALDGSAAEGKFSFMYTLMHELAHGLGMVDSFDAKTGKLLNEPIAFVYDGFVNRGAGQRNRVMDHASAEKIRDLTSNDLFFNGENATVASQESIRPLPMVKLYAPDPFQAGSSVSHVDQDTYSDVKTGLMVPTGFGAGSTLIDSLTLAIIKDLGYEMVPPPPTAVVPTRGQQ
jgi:hypothetical protein